MVLVERGERLGYLISEEYSIGDLPNERILSNVVSLSIEGDVCEIGVIDTVHISCPKRYWTAMDLGSVELVPCPALEPYPILFISSHGFEWMRRKSNSKGWQVLATHLRGRFRSISFATDRNTLASEDSPFRTLQLHRGRERKSLGEQSRGCRGLDAPLPSRALGQVTVRTCMMPNQKD